MKMFYADAQTGTNTCAGPLRGGCQHLCLAISATDHVCRCALGYDVEPKNPTHCIPRAEFIFYSIDVLQGVEMVDPSEEFDQPAAVGETLINIFHKYHYLYPLYSRPWYPFQG